MRVILEFKLETGLRIDLRSLQTESLLGMSRKDIERQPVTAAGRPLPLGEFSRASFSDRGEDSLSLNGNTSCLDYAGYGMDGGRLVIEGDAGCGLGMEMRSGEIEVKGNVGNEAGVAMQGGQIRITGNAGDWCGAAQPGQPKGMTGGFILVGGDAGNETGVGMRRGLVFVAGNSGEYTGARMNAGTILCMGKIGKCSGLGMKRGSIVAGKAESILPGFCAAGGADNEWLKICLRWLRKTGIVIPDPWLAISPERFTGDHLEMGKGELLIYDGLE